MNRESKFIVMIHSTNHSSEDLILNKEIFFDVVKIGDYVRLYDPEIESYSKDEELKMRMQSFSMVFQIKENTLQNLTRGRFEISLSKVASELLHLKPLSNNFFRFEKIIADEAYADFVELTFKKQFIQRGNMWRFKNAMIGRAIHIGQSISADGIQAQVQEIGYRGKSAWSGVILPKTNVVFRSRSTRIIWLVQISKEMWDFDSLGDLYFEKFLHKFVEPLMSKWKALSVSHSLTIIFFARSYRHCYSETSNKYEDYFKVVVENLSEFEKISMLKTLKKEFWSFANEIGWKGNSSNLDSTTYPSDAYSGNFLEAINSTLNLLDKHYMDRDLQRTGNSIVMISAGYGIFRVTPDTSRITKERMMDGGIGLDFISLSQPPLHTVPLFHIDCREENLQDFYEVPHWMNISFVDCDKDSSATLEKLKDSKNLTNMAYRWTGLNDFSSTKLANEDLELNEYGKQFNPAAFGSILSGQINGNFGDATPFSFLENIRDKSHDLKSFLSNSFCSSNSIPQWGMLDFPIRDKNLFENSFSPESLPSYRGLERLQGKFRGKIGVNNPSPGSSIDNKVSSLDETDSSSMSFKDSQKVDNFSIGNDFALDSNILFETKFLDLEYYGNVFKYKIPLTNVRIKSVENRYSLSPDSKRNFESTKSIPIKASNKIHHSNARGYSNISASLSNKERTILPSISNANFDPYNNTEKSKEYTNNSVINDYRIKSNVNPFIIRDHIKHLNERTHNRRRWSYVFPSDKLGKLIFSYYGLNWKSLTQPAILPIVTDYIPTITELNSSYDVQSNYRFSMDKVDCPFDSLESIMTEMICQRLSMEFQLVDVEDIQPYVKFANRNSMEINSTSKFAILSMGHRIQFLTHTEETQEIAVTLLLSKQSIFDRERCIDYQYNTWVKTSSKFDVMFQRFHQFPTPEFSWNTVDYMLFGQQDMDSYSLEINKAKRLRFNIIPKSNSIEYSESLEKLMSFFSKYIINSDSKSIRFIDSSSIGINTTIHAKRQKLFKKLFFRGPNCPNPNFAFIKFDELVSFDEVFHLEIFWLVCDSWIMEDFINILFRRCSNFGIKLTQVPEFFFNLNLTIHPYRSQYYYSINTITDNSNQRQSNYLSSMRVIENLLMNDVNRNWLFDYSKAIDFSNLDYSQQMFLANRNLLPALAININDKNDKIHSKSHNGYIYWTQYVHKHGNISIRLNNEGFFWMTNIASRISDSSNAIEDRRSETNKELEGFIKKCHGIVICYELTISLIESIMIM